MRILATQKNKLMPQVGRSVQIDSQKIALFQTSDGAIYALEDYCPLTDSPILEGVVSGTYLYEPMRDYKISLVDGKVQEPDTGQLKTYSVFLDGDDVYLEV